MIEDPLLTWKGRRVRSSGDSPETVARKVPMALRPGSLFFIPSPLDGWGLDTLLKRLSSDSVVVVFEKDGELTDHCRRGWDRFLGSLVSDPRLFRLESDTESAVQSLFRQLPLHGVRRCEFLPLNGAWLAHAPRYREVFSRFDEGLTRWWSNRMTCLHMGPLWIKNLFANLAAPGFSQAPWPNWDQDTVLVCGAGVSLESTLPWAQKHRSRLKLIAADTALPILKAWDLIPDAVVCLEAQHANLRDFAGWKGADVRLFTDLTSYPPGTRIFKKPPCWFITEFAELALWSRWPWTPEKIPRLPPLGSVGVAAAWIAWRLTSGKVILSGLDFSFPSGRTHARGAPSLGTLAAQTHRFHPLEQVGTWERPGNKWTKTGWLTTPVMDGYAKVLADHAAPEAHRTWVWDKRGLPLGLPVWSGEEPSRVPASKPPRVSDELTEDSTNQDWLAVEEELWRTILDDFDRINQNPDEEAWADLETHLAMTDYLTFCFADPPFRRDSDWLIRAQVQVRWILDRVVRKN